MQGTNNDGLQQKVLNKIYENLEFRNFSITANYVEIYNETIYDLLSENQSILNIREDINKGVYLEKVQEY